MRQRTTLKDIARLAGVGTATVDRVLNGRGGVAEETASRILRLVKDRKYGVRDISAHRGIVRIEVIMVRPDSEFFRRLSKAFERLAALVDSTIMLHRTFLPENAPEKVAHHIANPAFRRAGLIIVAPEGPMLAQSLEQAVAEGVHVVQIVTRLHKAIPYVGIDNYAAGRTAGFFMTSMLARRPGKLLCLCHSGVYEVHRQRVRGFSDFIEQAPDAEHRFHSVMLGLDEDLRSADVLSETLEQSPDAIGLYNAGGSNRAVASVLKKHGGKRIVWIGHELQEDTRAFLESGLMTLVIDQAPELQARRSLDYVLGKLGFMEEMEPAAHRVGFVTAVAESI